tara:strand:- start:402 stop:641 length:240 start_codon:yes stop_codon:yes gene_type:complete
LKKLLFISLIVFFSCSKNKKCGEIVQKYIQNDKYYFAMIAINSSNNSNNTTGGGDVFGDAEVSIEIYNSFEIGDEYCIE